MTIDLHAWERHIALPDGQAVYIRPLRPDDDFISIRRRMERDMAVCMLQAVRDLRDGMVEPQPQAAAAGRNGDEGRRRQG